MDIDTLYRFGKIPDKFYRQQHGTATENYIYYKNKTIQDLQDRAEQEKQEQELLKRLETEFTDKAEAIIEKLFDDFLK